MRRLIAVLCAFYVGPALAQEAPARSPLFDEIAEILTDLSQLTGWKAPKKVDSDTITKDGLKGFLESRMQEIVKPEEVRAEEVALKKLGLVPETFDLKKMTVDLLTEQAAAFYDYQKKKLFILDTNATITQKPVLVHELAHALADMHVNLEKYILKGKSDDAALARQAVMEGQATWLMSEHLMARMGTSLRKSPEMAEAMNRMTGASGGMFPVFDSSPLYLRESLMFPYTKGFLFQQAVIVKMDKPGFLEVFKNPPQSTQQIIHPEKYFAKVQPVKVALPKVEVKGYDDLVEGTLGEFDHDILFRQYGGEAEAKWAQKWRGGQFRVYEHKKDKSTVLLYASEWEDAQAAQEAFRLYRLVLKGKWKTLTIESESAGEVVGKGDDGPFRLKLEGTRLTSLEGKL
ncbi:MAG: hypothetical protein JNK48_06545 [Bryobacterales bacterium]|nr:hypothetical protein [Bryobacterales bacterium]